MTAIADVWSRMVQACILGTAARDEKFAASSSSQSDNQIEAILSEIENQRDKFQSKEELMLARLAAVGTALRALPRGSQTEELLAKLANHQIEVCQDETRAVAPAAALSLLLQLVEDTSQAGQSVLKEWFRECLTQNKRIPEYQLPVMLERLKNARPLHDLFMQCGGEHFSWLIRSNSEWLEKYPQSLGQVDKTRLLKLIDEGNTAERTESFAQLRKLAPALAREAILADWKKEAAETRITFIQDMVNGLSIEDESFLQDLALVDKRVEVRNLAQRYLIQFEESAHSQNLEAELLRYLQYQKKMLVVDFANVPEKTEQPTLGAAFRDMQLGAKSLYVFDLLLKRPVSFYERRLNLKPAEALQAISDNAEDGQMLLRALLESAASFPASRGWQEAILSQCGDSLMESEGGMKFLASLPQELAEPVIKARLPLWARQGAVGAPRLDIWYHLEHTTFVWSADFTGAICDFIIKECSEKVPALNYTFQQNARAFAARMHLSAVNRLPEFELALNKTDNVISNYFSRSITQIMEVLELRSSIKNTFANNRG